MRVVTNSEMETFKECRRKWWLQYLRKLQHKTDPDSGRAARVGTIYHSVMEIYYGNDQTQKGMELALQAAVPPLGSDQDTIKEYELARVMAEGYFQWLQEEGADADYTFQAVEEKVTADSPVPGVGLMGKVDLLATNKRTGELLIVDHKTTSSFQRSMVDIHLLRQPRLYSLIRQINEPDAPLHGVLWNLARSVKRGSRAKPPFYMRYELSLPKADLRMYWRELNNVIRDMLELEDRINAEVTKPALVAYPTPSKDCSWKCPFYSVCGYFDMPGFDIEGILEDNYETYDPLERYEEETPDALVI